MSLAVLVAWEVGSCWRDEELQLSKALGRRRLVIALLCCCSAAGLVETGAAAAVKDPSAASAQHRTIDLRQPFRQDVA